jgi:hypothetical protein
MLPKSRGTPNVIPDIASRHIEASRGMFRATSQKTVKKEFAGNYRARTGVNSPPERQIVSITTASFRAKATLAFLRPDRRQTAVAQSLKLQGTFDRVSRAPAASKRRLRVRRSPHFVIFPVRSTSPD